MSRIRLIDVNKQFGEHFAVRGLSLDIAQGEFVSFVGGSGCGKTTTLRLIAGFEEPTSGEVWLGDRRVNGVPVQDRGVGIVFQSYALFPTMTVGQNIGFGLEMAGRAAEVRVARVKEMIALVHLEGLGDRYPWQLSGGQQQRVALARALAISPRVLLLDEPLSALDARIRLSLRSEIRRIQQDLGITAVYVTHDQEEALAIADRIVVMDRGVVQQVGNAQQVYDRPENAFVAGFVGVSNLFQGVWRGAGQVQVGTHLWSIPGSGPAGGGVLVAVRPERLKLALEDQEGPSEKGETATSRPDPRLLENRLSGRLGVRTFLGSSWRVEVVQGEQRVLVDVPREEEVALARTPMGAPVTVSFRAGDAVTV